MSDEAVVNEVAEQAKVKVLVKVNRQDVELRGREVTGLEIKEAAIVQGVKIDLGFRLSHRTGHKWVPVADDERIKIHKGEEFRARTPEENS